MNYSVYFIAEDLRVDVAEGATLLEAQTAAALPVDAPCGGRGTCHKCAVGYRPAGEAGWRRGLACKTLVTCDLEVLRRPDGDLRVMLDGRVAGKRAYDPMVRRVKLSVSPCAKGESISDWTRLCAALDAALGQREWQPCVPVCRALGRLLYETKGEVWAVVSGDNVLDACAEEPTPCMAAFDLGTTSVAGYLIRAADGQLLAADGMSNPQAQYGGDVISRADYAMANGADALAECARGAIDALLRRMCERAGVRRTDVCAISLVGNTAMHHLFLGVSPDSLVRAPYNPVISAPLALKASEYGISAHPEAMLYALPVIGGFVGADTVGCLISGDWTRREKLTLMIDIGTNGELVMGSGKRRLACSTAAGPALEGAKISCGMRGADGAIDRVWLEDGAIRWHVIGDAAPRGICGSGLVDLVAVLLQTGAMDESGRLEDGDRFELGDTGLSLTQRDVREVQLAKAAIAAGIRLLAQRLGIALSDIEEVDIAGAFGNYIDPDSACAIGLIPPELREKIVPVGNAAGEGARLALTDAACWAGAEALAGETEFLELATMPQFQDEFVDQLGFDGEE